MERDSSSISTQGNARTPREFVDSIPGNRIKRVLVQLAKFTKAINKFLGDSSSLVQNALMASRHDSIVALVPEYVHYISRNTLTEPLKVLSESSRKVTPFCISLCIVPAVFGVILQVLSSLAEMLESSNMMISVILGVSLLGAVECLLLILYHEKKRRVVASIASQEDVMSAKRLLATIREKNVLIMQLIDDTISNPEQKKSDTVSTTFGVLNPTACPICSGKVAHVYFRDPDYKLLCPSCQRRAKGGFASGLTLILVGLSAGVFTLFCIIIFPVPLLYSIIYSIFAILWIILFTYVLFKNMIVQNKKDIKISARDRRNIDELIGAGVKDRDR